MAVKSGIMAAKLTLTSLRLSSLSSLKRKEGKNKQIYNSLFTACGREGGRAEQDRVSQLNDVHLPQHLLLKQHINPIKNYNQTRHTQPMRVKGTNNIAMQ